MQFNLFIISVFLYHTANSQQRTGVEEFFYVGKNAPSTVVPRIYYQTNAGWYGEVRYNYEEERTGSLYAGKTFSKQGDVCWSLTPVAGLIWGKLKGGAAGLNVALAYRDLSFSSALQYAVSREDRQLNFFYAWSELGCQVAKSVYAGLAIQQTRLFGTTTRWDPGLQVGFLIEKWTFPFYVFDPMGDQRHFVLGVTREWNRQKHPVLKH